MTLLPLFGGALGPWSPQCRSRVSFCTTSLNNYIDCLEVQSIAHSHHQLYAPRSIHRSVNQGALTAPSCSSELSQGPYPAVMANARRGPSRDGITTRALVLYVPGAVTTTSSCTYLPFQMGRSRTVIPWSSSRSRTSESPVTFKRTAR